MFRNYVLIAWRNLLKHKSLSVINIGGLVIGIASAIVLLSYVTFQSGYDRFNVHEKDIYRVDLSLYEHDRLVYQTAENYPGLAPALKKELPGIVDAARLYNMGYKNNCVFTGNNHDFRETKFMYADASFLRMFTYPFVKGDPSTALSAPFSAVISESFAKKMFGDEDPIGQSIKMNDDDRNAELCRITGVFRDVPADSHLQFNVLISYTTLDSRDKARYESSWGRKDFYTYIQLRPGASAPNMERELTGIVTKYLTDEPARHQRSMLHLQPLSDIHLSNGLADEPETTANPTMIGFLIVITFFILAIGYINYINMTTASSASRTREIGVRKVLGSGKADLVRQFLIESFALNVISVLLAVGLVYLFRPLLEQQFHLPIQLSGLLNSVYGMLLLGALLLGTILSGMYPAFVLSSLKPVSVLKGKISSRPGGLTLRRSLLVFQFALSVFLIIGTGIVYQQVHYMLNKDLGMKISQVVVLDRPGKWDTARRQHNTYVQRFRDFVSKSPYVEAVGMSDELPAKEIRNPQQYSLKDAKDQTPIPIGAISIDEHFLSMLQFKFAAGRNFSPAYRTDGNAVVMSASAARALGFSSPAQAIGKQVITDGTPYAIVGVVDDFHQMSLEKTAQPIVFHCNNSDAREFEYYLIKIKTNHASEALQQIQASWNEAFRDNPFQFHFLDEDFNRQYAGVITFRTFFASFAGIAIVLSCIGLFSLLAFMVQQRVKEIGIRKVLGAGVGDILQLLSKDFLRLLLLANLLAWPLGWWLMNGWLKGFPYRIQIHFMLFLTSGLAAFVIALMTISLQVVRAAKANPVQSLKAE